MPQPSNGQSVATVGSPFFVGLELRQSQQIAIAAQYQERTNAGREYFYGSFSSSFRLGSIAESVKTVEWPDGLLGLCPETAVDLHYWSEH